jgi:DNA repair photolyase
VISASRRTDLVASFPEWFASALRRRRADLTGPRGRAVEIDLAPSAVHTIVIWSKDLSNLLRNAHRLGDLLAAYDQVYVHFTVTGLGGTAVEPGVPAPQKALAQLGDCAAFAGDPRRVTVRFDPVLFWEEGGTVRSNLDFFPELAAAAAELGIRDIRTSFAQWYGRAKRRAAARDFPFVDPPEEEKRVRARALAAIAAAHGLTLHACSQPALDGVPGVAPSACIDAALLEALHPRREPAARRKDRSQRAACLCTESKDIGSYTQACPHGCVYCYAHPVV